MKFLQTVLIAATLCLTAALSANAVAAEPTPELSSEPVSLDASLPNGWAQQPAEQRGPAVIGAFVSPDKTALVTIRHLRTEPRSAQSQAAAVCDWMADKAQVARAKAIESSKGRASCDLVTADGERLRVYVAHLGPNADTQVLAMAFLKPGVPSRNRRTISKLFESLRLSK